MSTLGANSPSPTGEAAGAGARSQRRFQELLHPALPHSSARSGRPRYAPAADGAAAGSDAESRPLAASRGSLPPLASPSAGFADDGSLGRLAGTLATTALATAGFDLVLDCFARYSRYRNYRRRSAGVGLASHLLATLVVFGLPLGF